MKSENPLFEPVRLGQLSLPNRVCMAPLTRNRADAEGVPGSLAARYYAQRASAGLIVTEAAQISPMGKGYADTPGIHDKSQAEAWRTILASVRAAGGRMVCQLWHVGRISHTSLLPGGQAPLSSSALRADAQTFTGEAMEPVSQPEAMSLSQIEQTLADYREAALWARKAGFDGVEVHGANGYLLDQFLQNGVNQRDDEFGGSIENRQRFLLRAIDAVRMVWPADQIGVRLSPLGQANDMSDSDPEGLFSSTYRRLSELRLAYLHVVESFPGNAFDAEEDSLMQQLRKEYSGNYIANGNYDGERAMAAIQSGHADAVTFGRPFISNPDLPRRLLLNADLAEPDPNTFYGGGAEGYTDYPTLDQA